MEKNEVHMINLSNKLGAEKYLVISGDDLTEMLRTSEIVFEQDTCIRDMIRILKVENHFFLQEKTNLGEVIIRQFDSEEDALRLVNERMEIYNKMWDGCGCKINYYE